MAASSCQPVVVPRHYDPMFKVDVLLHAPLLESSLSSTDLFTEIMTLSLQLDCLCKRELFLQPTHRIENSKTRSSFSDKANVVYSNLQSTLSKTNTWASPDSFFQGSGLDELFPRVAAYLARPESVSMSLKKTALDNYFSQLSSVHHTLALSRQIHQDVTYQARPKYLAHQMAVLYHAINSIQSGGQPLERHKVNIEENFKTLKSSLADMSEDATESLPLEIRNWIMDLTDSIIQVVCSLPHEMTKEVLPVAQVCSH